MQLKSVYKCLTITALLAQIAVFPSSAFAEKANTNKIAQTEQQEETPVGLVGQYFTDDAFMKGAFIQVGEKSSLIDKKFVKQDVSSIQSVRWEGQIKPSQTGNYTFSTSSDENVNMKINGKTVIQNASMDKEIQLEKGKKYTIQIDYRIPADKQKELQVFWQINNQEKTFIPEKNILSPEWSESTEDAKQNKRQKRSNTPQSTSDYDGDGIFDELERNGYTYKNRAIVPWDDSYSAEGYKKYISNPYERKTALDPYTDWEKVTKTGLPNATDNTARDPLVAAYPAVGVGMERLHFSKNETVGEGISGTKSKTVTQTSSVTNTVDVSGAIGWGDKGFSFSFTPKYSHSWTKSTAIAEMDSETWSSQISINTAESAFLNANVRYHNAGTAPIYEVTPTTNFVLEKEGRSLGTVTAGPNTISNSLAPNAKYPAEGQAPISLDKANQTGTIKMSIDAPTLDKIQSGGDAVTIETPQVQGFYGRVDAEGNLNERAGSWAGVQDEIDTVTGALTLNIGQGKEALERRVVGKTTDPEYGNPDLTLKEAITRAFNATEQDGRLYMIHKGKEIELNESALNLIMDEQTKQDVERQLSQMPGKTVYDVKWKAGMKITLHSPEKYDNFETDTSQWTYTSKQAGGYGGSKFHSSIATSATGYATNKPELKPYTSYTARAYVRTDTGANTSATFFVGEAVPEGDGGRGKKISGDISGDEWKLVEFSFNTGPNPEYFKEIGIKNTGNAPVRIDDVSVSEWKTTESIQHAHVVDKWQYQKNPSTTYPNGYKMSSMKFQSFVKEGWRYQVSINDQQPVDIPESHMEDTEVEGKQFRTLKLGSDVIGLPNATDKIVIYAVDSESDDFKVKVAENTMEQKWLPKSLRFIKPIGGGTFERVLSFTTNERAEIAKYTFVDKTNEKEYPMGNAVLPNTSGFTNTLATFPSNNYSYAIKIEVGQKEFVIWEGLGSDIHWVN